MGGGQQQVPRGAPAPAPAPPGTASSPEGPERARGCPEVTQQPELSPDLDGTGSLGRVLPAGLLEWAGQPLRAKCDGGTQRDPPGSLWCR